MGDQNNNKMDEIQKIISALHEKHEEMVKMCIDDDTIAQQNPLVLHEKQFRENIIIVIEYLLNCTEEKDAKISNLWLEIRSLKDKNADLRNQISIITEETHNENNPLLDRIQGLTEDIREINQDFLQLKNNTPNLHSGQTNLSNIVVNNEGKPPNFHDNEKDRPLKFLRDMRQYVEGNNLELGKIKYTLSRCLQGNAASWWDIICDRIESWDDFEKYFRERFWSEFKIKKLRETLRFGRYRSNISRMQYASDILSLMYELEPETSEAEKIALLINHFERNVQIAMIGREINSLSELNRILEQYDQLDANFKKPENFKKQDSFNKSQQRNFQPNQDFHSSKNSNSYFKSNQNLKDPISSNPNYLNNYDNPVKPIEQTQVRRENFQRNNNNRGNPNRGRGAKTFNRSDTRHDYNLRSRSEGQKSINTIETDIENKNPDDKESEETEN